MMMRGARVLALFLGYGLIGLGGDYAVGLLGQEAEYERHVVVDVEPMVEVGVDVDVDDIDVDVRVRHSGSCRYETERSVAIDATAAQWLRLNAGAGELAVEGRTGLDQVQAVARVCASDETYLDDLRVTVQSLDGDIVLSAHYPDRSDRRNWSGNNYARIDLAVAVPQGMSVDLDDSSGDMVVEGTGETHIDDSSGEILVREITGALFIDDSSGEIMVHGVTGSATIDDSSGEIEVASVTGAVDIDDGSGEIEVRDIGGTLTVSDGSGEIDIEGVSADVVIAEDGSGSISVEDVGGSLTVVRDGSGSIRHSGVAGAVDVPKKRRRGN